MISVKGATVIAISPEIYDFVEKTIEKTKASYPVIHDEISNLYKVNYALDEKAEEIYKGTEWILAL